MVSPYTLPPELLAKAHALASDEAALSFGSTGASVVALLLLERVGAGQALLALARKVSRRAWVQGLVVLPVALAVLAVLALPLDVAGHVVGRQFGLSVEGWAAWFVDWAEASAIQIVLGTLLLSGVYALLRHSPRRAWLWAWVATVPLTTAGVWATPLFIDPLFNHFTPLVDRDPTLVARLEQVAAKGGLQIPPSHMFVEDASRRSAGVNAYVTGIGSSKRIVVWDTALRGIPADELVAIYGHEQGHYVLRHIPLGMLFSSALLLLLLPCVQALLYRNSREPAAWSSLPMLLLVTTVIAFLAEPAGNAWSRMEEHQADVYGQHVIEGIVPDPRAAELADFNRLGRIWLEEPDPNPFVAWWTGTHPTTSARAEWAATH